MLSDLDVFNRLHAALEALGEEEAVTTGGNAAIRAARLALTAYQMAIVARMQATTERNRLPPVPRTGIDNQKGRA